MEDNKIAKNKLLVYLAGLMETIRQEHVAVAKFNVANKTEDNIFQRCEVIRGITVDITLYELNEVNMPNDTSSY